MTGPNSLTLNDGKAGMEGLDKDRINRIIREASKGSKFFQHAEKKEKELADKIEKMLQDRNSLTQQMISQSEGELDGVILRLEASRDLSRDIVHVDMDAFYAAVEMRDDPSLRDVPMAVGSSSMLSTSNYLARKHGVRAAMPGFIARKLCPGLVIVPGNHDKYRAVSQLVMEVIAKYTDKFSAISLDEVYIDLTDLVHSRLLSSVKCPQHSLLHTSSHNSRPTTSPEASQPIISDDAVTCDSGITRVKVAPTDTELEEKETPSERECWCSRENVVGNIVRDMRRDIEQTTQLTASAGISCNTFLSKVCSDLNKPNGQYQLPPCRDVILDFVAQLDIKKVPGIGRVQQAMLSALDITKVSDLMTHRGVLAHLFTPASVNFYLSTALALGSSQVSGGDEGRTSMSTESTFNSVNVNEGPRLTPQILDILTELCETLAQRLSAEDLAGETVTIKVKLSSFEILQRSRTVGHGVRSKTSLEQVSKELLSGLVKERGPDKKMSARLLGVRVHNWVESGGQSSLLSYTGGSRKWECPVCGGSFPANVRSFNQHVDSCVERGNSHVLGEEEAAASMTPTESCPSNQLDDNKPVLITPPRGVKRRSTEPVGESSSKRAPQSKVAERWECPVCLKKLAPDLIPFNVHIDRCLAKDTDERGASDPKKVAHIDNRTSKKVSTHGKQSILNFFKRN